uniref:Adenylate kinase isoenzyme 5 n=1 Tax=Anopheles culicifacies TaxID=139723 RepID=A0A182MEY9_9DIPT
MGICLDTEKNNTASDIEDPDWKGGGPSTRSAVVRTPKSAIAGMQNTGKVKFDPPKVPVIFVLGGPGSGKVTHCDTLMQERRGVTHINMMDLLQQYAIGNDMQDFSQLSSRTVTEVLMLEMKMSPAAKTYLVSGYPRSMRDVVEYSEKIQVINGVILISWRQAILQKQIDYGAKLGHVVLSLAKMELENFFKNVMPVADYFDQSDMLIAINGERSPSEVYKDFRTAVLDILGAQENQEALLNGVAANGARQANAADQMTRPTSHGLLHRQQSRSSLHQTTGETATLGGYGEASPERFRRRGSMPPPIIWVIGGPGSNKASLCLKAMGINPGWGHFSVGRSLRAVAESGPRVGSDNYAVKEAITAGEMVPKKSLDALIQGQLMQLADKRGVIIDGYPRDMEQVTEFEQKYNQKPPIILLDCSKLQLGRGRLDDTVSSFRRRLELFRELTLPMLKEMDTAGRLTIVSSAICWNGSVYSIVAKSKNVLDVRACVRVDGDTDSPSVQREFERIVRVNMERVLNSGLVQTDPDKNDDIAPVQIGTFKTVLQRTQRNSMDAIVQDLDTEMPGAVPTISHHVSLANGHLPGSGKAGPTKNGYVPNGRPNFRNMLEEADSYPIDSHI